MEFSVSHQDETDRLAASLLGLIRPGDIIALDGALGSGKTAFARALIRAACGNPAEEVPSPTFTLVQTYATPVGEIWHLDLYRLTSPEDAHELAIEDAFSDAISLIEWPDRLGNLLPANRLDVHIGDTQAGQNSQARTIIFTGQGSWADRLAEAARQRRLSAGP
jgi:tRNA threonylcarbamoyladenosine biosynthesis protein TsaE